MMNALDKITALGILPVIKIEDISYAVPLAKALRAGGVNAIEVTARNDVAFEAITAIKKEFPDMTVGAGTILSPDMVDTAVAAGAEYCVSPGYNPRTVQYCIDKNIPIVPGCSTASEIEIALEAGLTTLKFFPAEANGGTAAIRDLSGPFSKVKFIATGGLNLGNIEDYLKMKSVAACGGSFMAKADVIKSGNWDKITADCKKAMQLSLGFRLAHIGINHDSREDATRDARALCRLFMLDEDVRDKCTFSGPYVENMNFKFYGEKGHIGFRSNSVYRAYEYVKSLGFEINEDSITYKNGEMNLFYLKDDIGGFAIHVI